MRISTNQMQLTAINAILDKQTSLSRTQLQVATGKRVVKPSDDPVTSASVLTLEQTKAQTERYQLNGDAARARLSIEDGVLAHVTNQIHRLREEALHANNSHLTNRDREYIAKEMRQILDEVLGLANTTDNNNQYLFSGHQGQVKPFSVTATGFQYDGDDGQRFLQVGASKRVADSDPGSEVFMNIMNGNGVFTTLQGVHSGSGVIYDGTVVNRALYTQHDYTINFADPAGIGKASEYTVTDNVTGATVVAATPYVGGADIAFDGIKMTVDGTPLDGDTFVITPSVEQDLFTTIDTLISALETPVSDNSSGAVLQNSINRSLEDLDQSLDNIINTRTEIGARLNAVDDQRDTNENFLLQVNESLSVLNDLDYAEAISRLNLQLTGLEASQKAFTRVQGLSLFNYL